MLSAASPGDIGLVAIEGHVGQIIRFGQWMLGDGFKNYSHAFTYADGGKIIEAMPGGAIMSELSRYDAQKILWLRCPPEYGAEVANAAVSFHGVPYGFEDYAALALHRFHIPTPHLNAFMASRKSMICSQLCDAAAQLGGWHIFDDSRDPGDVTPGDLTGEALRHLRIAR